MSEGHSPRTNTRLCWLAFWVSAAVLAFEISLMRILLVASWSHFAFLVISITLLGFGASGTALTLVRRWAMRHRDGTLLALSLLTAVSMPLCTTLAQFVPVEARFVPSMLHLHVGTWTLYWFLLSIPFFLGASVLGLALMVAGQRIAGVYGANLIGSGLGALLALMLMYLLLPAWLPSATATVVLIGAAGSRSSRPGILVTALTLSVVVIGGIVWMEPPHIRSDPYKYSAYVARLHEQGEATLVARLHGPRGVVEAYQSPALHDLPFLSVGLAPPPITAIVIDGHWTGSVLQITTADEAEVVDHTLMAAAYDFAPPQPRVALLGEIGGTNIWLAVRRSARTIEVVQPYPTVTEMMRGPLKTSGGAVLGLPTVRLVTEQPRHFIDQSSGTYDVIQLVALESLAAGSGGVGGLGQDDLITVQGIQACLESLSDDGILFVCRGIQTPPRDNIKLLATIIEALHRMNVAEPAKHVVIVRDYLAVCTIVRVVPLSAEDIARVRMICNERQLTPVWFDGIRDDELNQPDALPTPPDGIGDWYHFAAKRLFSPNSDMFIDQWHFNIRPATDDRPFFHDFFKLTSIDELKEAFGDLWVTRTELAYLFVLAAGAIITVIAVILIVLPLVLVRDIRLSTGRLAVFSYFAAIGLAYLLLEMTFLSRLTRLIGDPVLAASVTIAGFLLFSGAGSMTVQRLSAGQHPGGPFASRLMFGLAAMGAIVLFMLSPMAALGGSLPLIGRCAVAMVVIAPVGYLMGFPMPMALLRLDQSAPTAIPWAWGINGFASVLAAPLAMIIGLTWGFLSVGLIALGLYVFAGLVFLRLPRRQLT